jgi:pimeloyl-ACP methyl ester carboxylesterase
MNSTTTVTQVVSRDGTEIAFWTNGTGPPLVLVHGAVADHTRWDALRPYLEAQVTVHAMDRRGRRASGDHPHYTIEREYEDVAAVVDAVAEAAGCPADLYGHSYGGVYAFGATLLSSNVGRLVLYEGWPTVDPPPFLASPELVARLEALLARDDRAAVVETVLRELANMTDEELDAYRAHPSWPARVAAAHTIPRESRTVRELSFDAAKARRISSPTLLLVGEESTVWQAEAHALAATLPDARVVLLDGQGHAADAVAPGLVADQLLGFLRQPR